MLLVLLAIKLIIIIISVCIYIYIYTHTHTHTNIYVLRGLLGQTSSADAFFLARDAFRRIAGLFWRVLLGPKRERERERESERGGVNNTLVCARPPCGKSPMKDKRACNILHFCVFQCGNIQTKQEQRFAWPRLADQLVTCPSKSLHLSCDCLGDHNWETSILSGITVSSHT